ncbi:hypothetical protein GWK48_10450 [Metallosphaera tengchongensis]|uniref:Uncharacterized protein n=1 Tax=Metallosphaera tengchongensis TaxID=1532350 RepID=A0A6N0NY16_9CREN|nr:hypothetical protein [Metallosphaera tengchongensis]QKR00753.1 hypothetical protein GWK48_10450 [Metallosphaera tengchongensis]
MEGLKGGPDWGFPLRGEIRESTLSILTNSLWWSGAVELERVGFSRG